MSERAAVLFRFRELLNRDRDRLAAEITAEHGKVTSDALGEIARGLENVEFACGIPQMLKGEYSEQVSREIDTYSIRQPLGVVAGITPFNFPVMVPLWMLSTALACGNAFILKPSEKVPGPAIILAELLKEAGLPDGVFSVVNGDQTTVEALLEHPQVAAISFVGSTPVARSIYSRATAAGKRCQALGGAKNHMLVMPDADLESAADAAVSAAFGSAGERCMAISVVLAHEAVADALLAAVGQRVQRLRFGPGDDPASDYGPLISAAHKERVTGIVAGARAEGATLVIDGRDSGSQQPGFFLGPTVLDGVKPGMRCYEEEIFGPVLSVMRVADFDEALRTINANPYGNGASIYTRDGGLARQFQFGVTAGMVGVNVPIPVPVAYYSFGGWKDSMFGDRHMYGPEGVSFYTRAKVVTSRWPEPQASAPGVNLAFPASG